MRIARWMIAALVVFALGCGNTKPKPAAPQPMSGGGVVWQTDFAKALQQAKQEGKPMLVDVMATWCTPCKLLQKNVWSRSDVGELSKRFIAVQVDGDLHGDLKAKFAVQSYPTTIFLRPDGTEMNRVLAAVPYEVMLQAMQDALDKTAGPNPK